ncbi:MAG: hypothetical protein GXZ11_03795 [Tissierellia bacterium]|nr:hypothetical protein [Tissierellia bacterium]
MNSKINWKQKLSSRKFWVALIGLTTAVLAMVKMEASSIEQISTIIMSFGTLIAYVIAEGFIDAKRIENTEKPRE